MKADIDNLYLSKKTSLCIELFLLYQLELKSWGNMQ